MTAPLPLLFINGAGLRGWVWDPVIDRLGDSYQSAIAQRPGAPDPVPDDAGLADYASAALDSAPWDRFVVIAHSLGGMIGAEMIRMAPERVAGFLAVSAVVPKAGGSFLSSMPLPQRWVLPVIMKLAGTAPPESAIRKGVASALPAEQASRIMAEYVPESQALYRDRIPTATFPELRGYVTTAADKELPEGLQRTFGNRLDGRRYSLDTGHLSMLEDPDGLADVIRDFGTEADASA